MHHSENVTFSHVKAAFYNPCFNLRWSTLFYKSFDRFKAAVFSNLVMAVAMATTDLKKLPLWKVQLLELGITPLSVSPTHTCCGEKGIRCGLQWREDWRHCLCSCRYRDLETLFQDISLALSRLFLFYGTWKDSNLNYI